jgi:hypothetical protein
MLVPLACLLVAACAAAFGLAAGGALGYGLVCGGLLGAAIGGTAASALRRAARQTPAKAFNVFVAGFLGKLGVLFAIGLVFFVHRPLAERLDPRSLLLAYAGGALVVLAAGVHVARCELRDGDPRTPTRP